MGIEAERDTKPANLALIGTIARELGVAGHALKETVGRLYRAGNVALGYTKTLEGALYDVEAVKMAVAPHLPELRERWSKSQAEEAAGAQRRAERAAAHDMLMASHAKPGKATAGPSNVMGTTATAVTGTSTPSKPMGQPGPTPKHTSAFPPLGNPRPRRPGPEVVVLRRRPVPTP
jgi:hypothetical protein